MNQLSTLIEFLQRGRVGPISLGLSESEARAAIPIQPQVGLVRPHKILKYEETQLTFSPHLVQIRISLIEHTQPLLVAQLLAGPSVYQFRSYLSTHKIESTWESPSPWEKQGMLGSGVKALAVDDTVVAVAFARPLNEWLGAR